MHENELLTLALRMRADLDALIARLSPRRHSVDFASVFWEGQSYAFTASQAHVVKCLWLAMENLTPCCRQETLLDAAGSDADSIRDLFRGHPAWGKLIVAGDAKGTYRLADGPQRDDGIKLSVG